jgi:hypothetical protein
MNFITQNISSDADAISGNGRVMTISISNLPSIILVGIIISSLVSILTILG